MSAYRDDADGDVQRPCCAHPMIMRGSAPCAEDRAPHELYRQQPDHSANRGRLGRPRQRGGAGERRASRSCFADGDLKNLAAHDHGHKSGNECCCRDRHAPQFWRGSPAEIPEREDQGRQTDGREHDADTGDPDEAEPDNDTGQEPMRLLLGQRLDRPTATAPRRSPTPPGWAPS